MDKSEEIETTSIELKESKPVRIGSAYHRKLQIMAREQSWSMTTIAEMLIEQAWNKRPHTIPSDTAAAVAN